MNLLRHFYYELKPYLPVRARIAFRRALARRVLARCRNIWPILEQAGETPAGWPGWPGQKQFAFVLTHDVEGQKGLDRSLQLASLEASCGFRSSFNFVPEGEYITPDSVRCELTRSGFEIGVHDLRHDGKLYRSKQTFVAAASRINHYLKLWKAAGFRSGFMHHNLDWLHYLDIAYDMSTFDTDPFEPQPDGVHTIFPFWVDASMEAQERAFQRINSGYAELPYTLPQDSTLFLLLEHKTAQLWQDKIDWIAASGGMVLVNVHPDYMAFGDTVGTGEYPSTIYSDLLRYVQSKYADHFWLALPSEVASYVKDISNSGFLSRPAGGEPVSKMSVGV